MSFEKCQTRRVCSLLFFIIFIIQIKSLFFTLLCCFPSFSFFLQLFVQQWRLLSLIFVSTLIEILETDARKKRAKDPDTEQANQINPFARAAQGYQLKMRERARPSKDVSLPNTHIPTKKVIERLGKQLSSSSHFLFKTLN